MLGFYLIGMNLSDILDLTKEDYKDGRVSFFRNKTNRLYDIRVEPEAKEIIDRYKNNSNSNELFSFMRITNSAGYAQFTTKCNHCLRSLGRKIYDGRRYDRIFLLDDTQTHKHCLPLLADWVAANDAEVLTMEAGDVAKNLDTLARIWQQLTEKGASRHSLLVNLGGGVVTDLGGFAAATFKRGIEFINIPTTLLSMVDAAVGGKTGINFAGLKNEIGAFCPAAHVVIDTVFLRTLDNANICSGYAEMLKHALLHNAEMWADHLQQDLQHPDYEALGRLVQQSIDVKERIVSQDPHRASTG